jgi:hypothetical protein
MYSYDKNFSIYNSRNKNYSYGNLNQGYRNQSPPGTLVSSNFSQSTPTAIIYQKESRICPKKGNNFYYKGVS